jgi:vancomycin resistance protein VanJ
MESGKLRQRLEWTLPVISLALIAAWAVGQFVRDRNHFTALMFYFPTPVLATWLLTFAWFSKRRRRFYLALAIAPLGMLLGVENQWIRPSIQGTEFLRSGGDSDFGSAVPAAERTPLRLVHWNLCHGLMGWEKQWQHLESLQADVIVLSEIPEPFDARTLSDWEVLTVRGMAVACHGTMTKSGTLIRGGALHAFHVTCHLADGPLEVMIADMTSNIRVPRDPFLRPFVGLLAERKIDVSLGDFNAPRRSLAFSELPPGFRHGYDAAGTGWSCTWPVPFPMLAIDQCIVGPRLKPIRYDLDSTLLSDHRIQILDVERDHEPPEGSL